jgi:hypothetical protein
MSYMLFRKPSECSFTWTSILLVVQIDLIVSWGDSIDCSKLSITSRAPYTQEGFAHRVARLFQQEHSYADYLAWATHRTELSQSRHRVEQLSAQVGLASLRAQTNDIMSRSSGLTEQLKSSRREIVELTRVYNAVIACRKTDQTARDKEVNGRFLDYQKTIDSQKSVSNKQLEKIAQQEQDKASQQAEHIKQIAVSATRRRFSRAETHTMHYR